MFRCDGTGRGVAGSHLVAAVFAGKAGRVQVLSYNTDCGTDGIRTYMSNIEALSTQALADIASAQTPDALESLRVALLGKSGSVTAQLKSLGALPGDQRKAVGEAINRARDAIGAALSRSEEHTSELQSLMRISYAVFCLKKKNNRARHMSTVT